MSPTADSNAQDLAMAGHPETLLRKSTKLTLYIVAGIAVVVGLYVALFVGWPFLSLVGVGWLVASASVLVLSGVLKLATPKSLHRADERKYPKPVLAAMVLFMVGFATKNTQVSAVFTPNIAEMLSNVMTWSLFTIIPLIGLVRRRSWIRYYIILIGLLHLGLSVFTVRMFLNADISKLSSAAPESSLPMLLIGFAISFLYVWLAITFICSEKVKRYFSGKIDQSDEPGNHGRIDRGSQITVDDIKSTKQSPALKVPVIAAALLVAVLIGLWQYWSWGPYTVTLDAQATKTNDFVVECWYGSHSFHGVMTNNRDISIAGGSDTIICPRHFLGPYGAGMQASVYHPEYVETSVHGEGKFDSKPIVLRPRALSEVMAEQETKDKKRDVLFKHIIMLEHNYLPEFGLNERSVLADRYVGGLQEYTRQAGGIYSPLLNDKVSEYVDKLFRKPRK